MLPSSPSHNRTNEVENFVYAARRTFLNENDAVEPPSLFKTKKQARRNLVPSATTLRGNEDSPEGKYTMPSLKNKAAAEAPLPKAPKSKKHPPVNNTLIIENYSSLAREDWKERTQAGVKIWINRSTGEVSTECPWLPSARIYKNRKRATDRFARYHAEEGTGSLVYDNTEMKELFDILDNCKLTSEGKTNSTAAAASIVAGTGTVGESAPGK